MEAEKRLDYLDGLKGIFTLLVVVGHFGMAFFSNGFVGWGSEVGANEIRQIYFSNMPWSLIINNSIPVYLFMTLIAFFPAYKYFIKRDNKSLAKSFILRYFRFMPMVAVACLLVSFFIKIGLYDCNALVAINGSQWVANTTNYSFTFLETIKEGIYSAFLRGTDLVSSLWCLDYLFLGSLLTYILVFLVCHVRHKGWLYLFVSIFFLHDPTYLCFIGGTIIADLVCNSVILSNKKIMILFLIIGIVVGYFPSVLLPEWLAVETIYAIGSFFIITAIIGLFSKTKLLNSKVLVNIGKQSFPIIIVHIILLFVVSAKVYVWLYNTGVNDTLNIIITFVTYIPLSLVASYLYARLLLPLTMDLSSAISNLFFKED